MEAVEGRWASDQTGEPHLVFAADGSVQGSDGCNEISTTYVQDGALVTLKNFASTLRACPGVDTWLRHGRVLEIDGSAMTVKNAEDEEIGTLTRDDAGTASPAPTET